MNESPRLHRRAEFAVVLGAGLACGWYVTECEVFRPFARRILFERAILDGVAEPPYRFRVLWPAIGNLVGRAVGTVVHTPHWRHMAVYGALTLVLFAATFLLLHDLLGRMFTGTTALLGTLLFAVAIPLSVTGYWMEDDYLTLLVFVVGFQLMARGRDVWIPALVAVGTLNREQTVYLAVFHALFVASRAERKWLAPVLSFVAWAVVWRGLRLVIGDAPSRFTVAHHLEGNLETYRLLRTIVPLWTAQFGAVAALAIASWRRSDRFFHCALIALVPYVVLFAINGNLWETAKFLPAELVLVPMALQTLTGETARLRA